MDNKIVALPQKEKLPVNITMKNEIQTELCYQLKRAWVLCSTDVPCGDGAGALIMDVTIETRSFIFGRIAIQDSLSRRAARVTMKSHGIETRICSSMAEIPGCVKWAVALQEKYVRCQAVCQVA